MLHKHLIGKDMLYAHKHTKRKHLEKACGESLNFEKTDKKEKGEDAIEGRFDLTAYTGRGK